MVSKIGKEDAVKRVAHLLNVIGKDGQELHLTFKLLDNDYKDVTKALDVFAANVIYEHNVFNKHNKRLEYGKPGTPDQPKILRLLSFASRSIGPMGNK